MPEHRSEQAPQAQSRPAQSPVSGLAREALPATGWRCEFARWVRRSNGSAITRLKPDLFINAWACAHVLILMMAWSQPPSRMSSWVLSVPSSAFLLHACWLLLRRHRLEMDPAACEIRGGSRLGGQRRIFSTEGLSAIQLVDRPTGLAADGKVAPPDQQALLVFQGEDGLRREALIEAREGTAEEAGRLARELAGMLGVDFLDHTGSDATPEGQPRG